MLIQKKLNERLLEAYSDAPYIEIINESHQHNVPDGSETHFKVILVSRVFTDLSRLKRHQHVMNVIQDLIPNPIHALSLKLYSPEEWQALPEVPESPPCRGGRSKETR